jgi:hypothetical protein
MQPVETVPLAKTSNVLQGVWGDLVVFADSNEFLHRLPLFVPLTEVTLSNGLAHEFRNGGVLIGGAGVECFPEVVVQVELRPPHDVYYTSLLRCAKYRN